MSNFSFIPATFGTLEETLKKAEQHVYSDAPYTALLCRKGLEEVIRWMYEHDEDLELPYDTSLNSLMHTDAFKAVIAPSFFNALNAIRKQGNDAAHTNKRITSVDALHSLKLTYNFVFWVANVYGEERIASVAFSEELVPRETEAETNRKQLEKLLDNYHQQQSELQKAKSELAEIKANKEVNLQQLPPPIDPNEDLTRKIYIDALLVEAGWDLEAENVKEYAVRNCMPQADGSNGNGFVDYVLWGDDGKALAVVEAKRTRRDSRVGAHQAKCYADCIEKEFGQRPIIYYSNGFKTWMWDDLNYAPRPVFGFYTKDELQALIQRRAYRKNLATETINDAITDRYYQHEAIRKIAETLERNQREALLVMATGTGKTRVSASLIDFLSKANWVKRVLFLADRNALIHQAKKNLNDYLPNLPSVDLTKEKEDESSRIVFSTYQTMINMIDGEMDEKQRCYGVGHFDLIIFDEIHRSVYNRYRHIFNYFDGIKIGLTATPKSETDKDTYGLFHLEPNNPTYAYELEQGVYDKFLIPPKAYSVPTKFIREGIKYGELSEEDKLKYEEEFVDPITGAFPDEIESTALNNWLFNIDTVDKVIGYIMQNGIKVEGGDKLAKTMIFARSHKHAKFIEERFNIQYPNYIGEFLKVIDNQEEYRYDLLNKFKDKTKMPQIAVSVDMLDTGIDVPEVCNLVFFKPVRSSSKFWQMLGRGTRLCENLFAEGEDKTEFLIFDLCENFEFFNANPKGFEGNAGKSLSQRLFELRLRLAFVLLNEDDSDNKDLGQSIINYLIVQTQNLKGESFLVRQHWEVVEKYRDANAWNALSDLDVKELFEHIAPLVTETDEDEMAKRFDVMMYDLQLYTLQGDKRQVNQIQKLVSTARKLCKKASIPTVSKKMDTLKFVQEKSTWESISVVGIERIRVELRDIMKFLEHEERKIVYTNYEDNIGGVTEPEILYGSNDLEVYKRKVEQYFKEQATHLTIHKLRNNIQITKTELEDLEHLLFDQGSLGTKELFLKAYGEKPLGKLVRSIVGLDVNTAKIIFSEILVKQTLNSQQIRFMDEIIKFFTIKGVVDPAMLFEPPFTDINSNGILGLFDETTSATIISLIENVNHTAEVA